jgi:hypothetical protein
MDAMCVVVMSEDCAQGTTMMVALERHPGDMQIGVDVIRGEPEICIMAIGLGQLIGRCVGRDKQGRFVSLTKRLVVGAYTGGAMEFERCPAPHKVLVVVARLVLGLTLAVTTAPAPEGGRRDGDRHDDPPDGGERGPVVRQQWRLVLSLLPLGASLVWLVTR